MFRVRAAFAYSAIEDNLRPCVLRCHFVECQHFGVAANPRHFYDGLRPSAEHRARNDFISFRPLSFFSHE
jgi:hypothetical protein